MVNRATITLANSIVGVSVLAMPFCFKQCGIVLATAMLMIGAVITRTICYFLLKAATITRRRNYEMLAWHTFGQGGKFIVEISIIGFLIGTLIAFFVVIGDLGPEIVSEIFVVENNSSLRNIIMAALSLFVALPLGLLRNIDSLSSVSTASVLFYVFLVFKILSEGIGPLFSGSYLDRVDYWRPAGVLQCIPIFSMALSCQTQIFAIYESLPEPSLHKMNEIIKQAVNICTLFYFCVGFFGYIAFCHQSFGGNILMTLSPSASTQLIKTCFLMSIVFGVPLVIFPCRSSLNSLIFRTTQVHHSLHDSSINYIPDIRLKCLTIGIIAFTLVIGILIPNIELVLGLVGSTTGSVICIIFPSIMFIRVTSKKTTERLLAQVLFFIGVVIMFSSTYGTLYAVEQAQVIDNSIPEPMKGTENAKLVKSLEDKVNIPLPKAIVPEKLDFHAEFNKFNPKSEHKLMSKLSSSKKPEISDNFVNVIEVENKEKVEMKDAENTNKKPKVEKPEKPLPYQEKKVIKIPEKIIDSPVQNLLPVEDLKKNDEIDQQSKNQAVVQQDEKESLKKPLDNLVEFQQQPQSLGNEAVEKIQPEIVELGQNINKDELVQQAKIIVSPKDQKEQKQNFDQINKIIKEGNANQDKDLKKEKEPVDEKNVAAALLKKWEEHEENQKKFIQEQRQIINELKEHHAQDVKRQKTEDKKDVAVEDTNKQNDSPNLNAEDKKEMESVKLNEKLKEGSNIIKLEQVKPGPDLDLSNKLVESKNVPNEASGPLNVVEQPIPNVLNEKPSSENKILVAIPVKEPKQNENNNQGYVDQQPEPPPLELKHVLKNVEIKANPAVPIINKVLEKKQEKIDETNKAPHTKTEDKETAKKQVDRDI